MARLCFLGSFGARTFSGLSLQYLILNPEIFSHIVVTMEEVCHRNSCHCLLACNLSLFLTGFPLLCWTVMPHCLIYWNSGTDTLRISSSEETVQSSFWLGNEPFEDSTRLKTEINKVWITNYHLSPYRRIQATEYFRVPILVVGCLTSVIWPFKKLDLTVLIQCQQRLFKLTGSHILQSAKWYTWVFLSRYFWNHSLF